MTYQKLFEEANRPNLLHLEKCQNLSCSRCEELKEIFCACAACGKWHIKKDLKETFCIDCNPKERLRLLMEEVDSLMEI